MFDDYLNVIRSQTFWERLWQDINIVLTSGNPPVYVQFLIITVIYLAYIVFFYDARRFRKSSLKRWLINPPTLVYLAALVVSTAGGAEFLMRFTDPATYDRIIRQVTQYALF